MGKAAQTTQTFIHILWKLSIDLELLGLSLEKSLAPFAKMLNLYKQYKSCYADNICSN